jgi:hypothetical protein
VAAIAVQDDATPEETHPLDYTQAVVIEAYAEARLRALETLRLETQEDE